MLNPRTKRKRVESEPSSTSSVEDTVSDKEADIFSALTGTTRKKDNISNVLPGAEDSDEELDQLIHDSISKRNVKGGTQVLKKTKGKAKMVKGEVGGGSFQSMGTSHTRSICMARENKY
jgi:ATP-dependent RNA helicase DDX54/DBP10